MSALDRSELYSTDSSGRRIPAVDKHAVGYTVMPVKETPRHALSEPSGELEERTRREGARNRKLAELTREERLVYELQLIHTRETDRQMKIPVSMLGEFLAGESWSLVRQENGFAIVSGDFSQRLTNEDIARLLGLSVDQVRRRITSARKKLRGGI
jgi:CRP-like cAMP-binding protein